MTHVIAVCTCVECVQSVGCAESVVRGERSECGPIQAKHFDIDDDDWDDDDWDDDDWDDDDDFFSDHGGPGWGGKFFGSGQLGYVRDHPDRAEGFTPRSRVAGEIPVRCRCRFFKFGLSLAVMLTRRKRVLVCMYSVNHVLVPTRHADFLEVLVLLWARLRRADAHLRWC